MPSDEKLRKMTKSEGLAKQNLARHCFTDLTNYEEGEEDYHLACMIQDVNRSFECDDGDCRICAIALAFAMGRMVYVENREGINGCSDPESINIIYDDEAKSR
jgi:hypothetical protein